MLGTPNVDRPTRRRAETRQEILEAAWDVVRESGWSGLTQRAVAARVGMRAPSLYGHFASKFDMVDAMFGQAWADYDTATSQLQAHPAGKPRVALHAAAEVIFDTFAADHDRYALMTQRPVPGFAPTEDAYGHAVRSLGRLHQLFDQVGIDDPDAADLWTALMAGLVSQQIANDPAGDRWRRLLGRAVDMFADEVGLDGRKKSR
jgi:AcrR family transcriptional regulator